MKNVPIPVQRGDKKLVLTKIPLDTEPQYILWFYHHMRKLGYRRLPTLDEAYHLGQYWLRKGRRQFPERKYRFALGEPLYVALQLGTYRGETVIHSKAPFLTLREAETYARKWSQGGTRIVWNGNTAKEYQVKIVIGYDEMINRDTIPEYIKKV